MFQYVFDPHRDSVAFASMKTTKMRTRDKMEAYD